MHVLLEGVLPITIRSFLQYLTIDEKLFSFDELNDSLSRFNFRLFRKDIPGPVLREHCIEGGTLRQSAAQTLTLAHTLLFVIARWTFDWRNDQVLRRIENYVQLLHIVNISLSYEIDKDRVNLLG